MRLNSFGEGHGEARLEDRHAGSYNGPRVSYSLYNDSAVQSGGQIHVFLVVRTVKAVSKNKHNSL